MDMHIRRPCGLFTGLALLGAACTALYGYAVHDDSALDDVWTSSPEWSLNIDTGSAISHAPAPSATAYGGGSGIMDTVIGINIDGNAEYGGPPVVSDLTEAGELPTSLNYSGGGSITDTVVTVNMSGNAEHGGPDVESYTTVTGKTSISWRSILASLITLIDRSPLLQLLLIPVAGLLAACVWFLSGPIRACADAMNRRTEALIARIGQYIPPTILGFWTRLNYWLSSWYVLITAYSIAYWFFDGRCFEIIHLGLATLLALLFQPCLIGLERTLVAPAAPATSAVTRRSGVLRKPILIEVVRYNDTHVLVRHCVPRPHQTLPRITWRPYRLIDLFARVANGDNPRISSQNLPTSGGQGQEPDLSRQTVMLDSSAQSIITGLSRENANLRASNERIKQQSESELDSRQDAHASDIKKLEDSNAASLKKLVDNHEAEKKKLAEAHRANVMKLVNDNAAIMNKTLDGHKTTTDRAAAAHDNISDMLKAANEDKASSQKAINKLEDSLRDAQNKATQATARASRDRERLLSQQRKAEDQRLEDRATYRDAISKFDDLRDQIHRLTKENDALKTHNSVADVSQLNKDLERAFQQSTKEKTELQKKFDDDLKAAQKEKAELQKKRDDDLKAARKEKAESQKKFDKDLAAARKDSNAGNQDLLKKLRDSESLAKSLKEEKQAALQQNEQLTRINGVAESGKATAESTLADLRHENHGIKQELSEASALVKTLVEDGRLKQMNGDAASADVVDGTTLAKLQAGVDANVANLRHENSRISENLSNATASNQKLAEENARLVQANGIAESAKSAAENSLAEYQAKIEADIRDAEAKWDNLCKEKSAADEALSEATTSNQTLDEELDRLTTSNKTLIGRIAQLRKELETLRATQQSTDLGKGDTAGGDIMEVDDNSGGSASMENGQGGPPGAGFVPSNATLTAPTAPVFPAPVSAPILSAPTPAPVLAPILPAPAPAPTPAPIFSAPTVSALNLPVPVLPPPAPPAPPVSSRILPSNQHKAAKAAVPSSSMIATNIARLTDQVAKLQSEQVGLVRDQNGLEMAFSKASGKERQVANVRRKAARDRTIDLAKEIVALKARIEGLRRAAEKQPGGGPGSG